MAISALAVANFFLKKAREENLALKHMKLQKLVYYAQGWHLALNESSLINEQVEAWKYGPVVRSIYHEFKEFGDQPIARLATDWPFVDAPPPMIPEDAGYMRQFLERVWNTYKNFTGVQLSKMTHAPGTPWDKINTEHNGVIPKGTDIPRDMMQSYFKNEAARK